MVCRPRKRLSIGVHIQNYAITKRRKMWNMRQSYKYSQSQYEGAGGAEVGGTLMSVEAEALWLPIIHLVSARCSQEQPISVPCIPILYRHVINKEESCTSKLLLLLRDC